MCEKNSEFVTKSDRCFGEGSDGRRKIDQGSESENTELYGKRSRSGRKRKINFSLQKVEQISVTEKVKAMSQKTCPF